MRIDDARLTSEGGANGRAVSTVNMEITGRRERRKIWANRGENAMEAAAKK